MVFWPIQKFKKPTQNCSRNWIHIKWATNSIRRNLPSPPLPPNFLQIKSQKSSPASPSLSSSLSAESNRMEYRPLNLTLTNISQVPGRCESVRQDRRLRRRHPHQRPQIGAAADVRPQGRLKNMDQPERLCNKITFWRTIAHFISLANIPIRCYILFSFSFSCTILSA